MFSKHIYTLRSNIPTRLYLLVVVVSALVLLSACGGGGTTSAGTATAPTTIANSPTVAQPTPTPTVAQPTPTPTASQATSTSKAGSKQVVLIINDADGSYGFSPGTLTIKAGTTVIWKNMSSAPHTVTTDDGQTADSGTVPVGGTFSFKFMAAGTFPYHCNYHPYMRAMIIVK
jgi:plastocyanin